MPSQNGTSAPGQLDREDGSAASISNLTIGHHYTRNGKQGNGMVVSSDSLPVTAHASPISTRISTPRDQTDYTGNLIQQELNSRASFSADRVWVLESAISFVTNYVTSSQHPDASQPELADDDVVVPDKIPSELLYSMFLGQSGSSKPPYHWPDHISTQALQHMCMALSNNSVSGQTAIQYKVCIFQKATAYVSRLLRFCEPGFLCDELQKSQREYARICETLLKRVDLVSHPTIGTLQALLSGATLVLLLGRTSQAWNLAALASRILVSLGLHTMTREAMADESKSNIRLCLYWSFYLDKTLSMLLVRPPSLPPLSCDPVALVPISVENPLTLKAKIALRLAQVQDFCLSLLCKPSAPSDSYVSETVGSLELQLQDIYKSIDEVREARFGSCVGKSWADIKRFQLHDEWIKDHALKLEWDMINFTIYSLFTTVLRFDTASLHSHSKREQCLSYARKALLAMQEFHPNSYPSSNCTTDFFSWTVLLFPLTPFFVVFCNVVATSNLSDLELLINVTSILSQIREQCTLSMNLFNLFSQFVQLCGQLSDIQAEWTQQQLKQRLAGLRPEPAILRPQSPPKEPQNTPMSAVDASQVPIGVTAHYQRSYPSGHNNGQLDGLEGAANGTVWDDKLIWQLFNMQPSIESFDLALLDLDLDSV